jgi:hypothetical protein
MPGLHASIPPPSSLGESRRRGSTSVLWAIGLVTVFVLLGGLIVAGAYLITGPTAEDVPPLPAPR